MLTWILVFFLPLTMLIWVPTRSEYTCFSPLATEPTRLFSFFVLVRAAVQIKLRYQYMAKDSCANKATL